jgi:hypothetical protein
MTDKERLIQNIEQFYSEAVEEYKEITLAIRAESTPMAIFRKKNYQQHIDKLKLLKKRMAALAPTGMKLDGKDRELTQLKQQFERALLMFATLCDHQIAVQTSLQNTANKKGGKFSESAEAVKKLNQYNKEVQGALHELDVCYADVLDQD